MNTALTMLQKSGQIGEYIGVEEILRAYFAEISGLSPLTLRVRRWDICLFLRFLERHGSLDLRTWLPLDTSRFRAELIKEGYAPNTINRILSSLRNFGRWGVVKHWPFDPCKGVADMQVPSPVPKAISEKDFYKITRAAELLNQGSRRKYDESKRNKALVAVLASSGLRISEVLNLRLHQLQGRRLVGVLCKRSKVRNILLSKEASDILRTYIAEGRTVGPTDHIFTSRYGRSLSRNGAALALEKLAHVAGVEGFHNPHAFRHRLGKRVRQLAGDVAAARKLGHSSGTRLVELYATTTDTEDEALADAI